MARKAKAPKKKPSPKKSKGGPAMSAAGVPVKAENWKATALSGKSPTIEVNFEDGSALQMRDLAAVMALTMLQTRPCSRRGSCRRRDLSVGLVAALERIGAEARRLHLLDEALEIRVRGGAALG